MFRKGFANVYKSVSLAFSVLPGILSMTEGMGTGLTGKDKPDGKKKTRYPGLQFRRMIRVYLQRADRIFEQFKHLESSLPVIYLVTGDREEGKTAFVNKMIGEMKQEGRKITGFLAIGIHDAKGIRRGFTIRNIETGEESEFCVTDGPAGWEKVGKFKINPAGLAKGYEWMSSEKIRESDVLVIDELGPLEMAGRGWSDLISRILLEDPKPMIWTVRRSLAAKIAVKWNVGEVRVVDAGEAHPIA